MSNKFKDQRRYAGNQADISIREKCVSYGTGLWSGVSKLEYNVENRRNRGLCRYIFIIALIFLCNACSTLKSSDPSAILWSHEESDITPDPGSTFGRLENGFRYVLKQNYKPKDRVAMHLYIEAGSLNETEKERGIAHFVEHMLFNGTKNFLPGDLVKYFQKLGMRFGPDANAHTGFTETVYDIFLPEGSDESISEGLLVLKDYLVGALFLPSEIEKEKGIILSEKNIRDSVSYRTFVSTLKFETQNSLISKRLPIGKKEILEKADRKLLKDFYDRWYAPQNCVVIIVGDFNKENAEKKLKEMFAEIKPRAPPAICPDIGDIKHNETKAFYHYEKEAGKTDVTIEIVGKSSEYKDTALSRKEDLLKRAGNMIVKRRIDRIIDEGRAPFISSYISSGRYLRNIEYSAIGAVPSDGMWKESLAALEKILREAVLYGFSDKELSIVKKELSAAFDDAVKRENNIESDLLAQDIIDHLSDNRVYNSAEQKKKIGEFIISAMTVGEVHKAFIKDWKNEGMLLLVTGDTLIPAQKDKSSEDVIEEVFYESSRIPVAKLEKRDEILFPYLEPPKETGKIVKFNEIKDLGIIQIDFANGVRLNLKKTSFDRGKIFFRAGFGYGRSSEPSDLSGLSLLTFDVINESGTGTFTNDELEEALAGRHTDIYFGIDEGSFLWFGTSVPEETELLFQLLYTFFQDTGYRENAYERAIEEIRQRYETMLHNVEGGKEFYLERFLAGGDTRFGFPYYEDVKKISLSDIKGWLAPVIKKGVIELSITGDFDIDTVIDNASLYLGGLPARKDRREKEYFEGPNFPEGEKKEFRIETKIPKGIVVAAYPTSDIYDIKRTRVLNVLASIFSEKMREIIREEKSMTYSSYAFNNPSGAYKDFGVLQAAAYVKRGEEEKTLIEIKKIASDIADGKITEDELERSKKPILTSIKDSLKTNSYWLDTVLSNSIDHPEKSDWARSIYKGYSEITLEEVRKAAKKYLDDKKAAEVIIRSGNRTLD